MPVNRTGLCYEERCPDGFAAGRAHSWAVGGGGWRGGEEKQGLFGDIPRAHLKSPIITDLTSILDVLQRKLPRGAVVVEDDDPHHDPHAEHQRFFTGKPTPVFPGRERRKGRGVTSVTESVCFWLHNSLV